MRFAFLILILTILFGFVGINDYDDALEQQKVYCENVNNGVWPDYKSIDC